MLSEEDSQELARWADELDRAPPVKVHVHTFMLARITTALLLALSVHASLVVPTCEFKPYLPPLSSRACAYVSTGHPAFARVRGAGAERVHERRAFLDDWPQQRPCQPWEREPEAQGAQQQQ
jgi:hypothetical protein